VPYQSTGGLAAASSPTRLAAFVVPCADGKPTAEEVRRHCLAELPRPKVPSHVETVSELPLNASLKVDRAALSRRAEAACAATLTPGGEA
jgi:acyl-CoA synthetase (AMP-forming)/AMP-acid ligase II